MTESAVDGASTLGLEPIGGVNQSSKQRVPVARENGNIVTANLKEKKASKFLKFPRTVHSTVSKSGPRP